MAETGVLQQDDVVAVRRDALEAVARRLEAAEATLGRVELPEPQRPIKARAVSTAPPTPPVRPASPRVVPPRPAPPRPPATTAATRPGATGTGGSGTGTGGGSGSGATLPPVAIVDEGLLPAGVVKAAHVILAVAVAIGYRVALQFTHVSYLTIIGTDVLVPNTLAINIFLYRNGTLHFGSGLQHDGSTRLFAQPRKDGLSYAVARAGQIIVVDEP